MVDELNRPHLRIGVQMRRPLIERDLIKGHLWKFLRNSTSPLVATVKGSKGA